VKLITLASTSSFFYSHRIWFFFQAMLFPEDDPTSKEQHTKSRVVLRSLKEGCIKSKERFYLTNSQDVVKLIQEFGKTEHYPWLVQMIQEGIIKKTAAEFANRGSKDLMATNEEKAR
jgi:hypothetical protein